MSVWSDRDLPVLRYLDANPPRDEMLQTNWQSTQPHSALRKLTDQDFHYSVETLGDAGYVSCDHQSPSGGGDVLWLQFHVTGAGKQILGQWPLFEALGQPDRLSAVLDQLGGMAASDEEEANLRNAAESVRGLGGEALERLTAGALATLVRSAT